MIPTPRQVLPIVMAAAVPLRDSLRKGVAYADELQPAAGERNPWFWSHSARYKAHEQLKSKVKVDGLDWSLVADVPNCGIHLRFGGLHKSRVVKTFHGGTPHPGSNTVRRADWYGVPFPQLILDTDRGLPPLSLVIDWQNDDGEPLIHVGLPAAEWTYQKSALLHWRVPLPDDGVAIEDLSFDGTDDNAGGSLIELPVDPSETGSSGW
jgi:hypothetical protein